VEFYGDQGRLLGHGVTFSALSAQWTPRQGWWMEQFRRECGRRPYVHVSEHFGFLSAGSFHEGAPLPVPRAGATLQLGQERLQQLSAAARVPIGLENLAFAFGPRDVHDQGAFLDDLLAPVNGFLLLDLHNIYCQMCNFDVPAQELLDRYPLHRVRELHMSGGSWSHPAQGGRPVRRDTHDEAVPDELYELLSVALERCPAVRAVILERLGDTVTAASGEELRHDFRRIRQTVAAAFPASPIAL